jgi:hypothetical protein
MKIETHVSCDGPGCDHVKKECNHWFLFFDEGGVSFTVEPWIESLADSKYQSKHACGEACLLKIISEHIKNATAEK